MNTVDTIDQGCQYDGCDPEEITPEQRHLAVFCSCCQKWYHGSCWASTRDHKRNTPGHDRIGREEWEEQVAREKLRLAEIERQEQERLAEIARQAAEIARQEAANRYLLNAEPNRGKPEDEIMWRLVASDSHGALQLGSSVDAIFRGDIAHTYPAVVSFCGNSQAGKSTIIKNLKEPDLGLDFPFNGVPCYGDGDATTGEINIYPTTCLQGADTGDRPRQAHFVDYEGMNAKSTPKGYLKQAYDDMRNKWSDGADVRRQIHINKVFPRLLYLFSDTICFVTTEKFGTAQMLSEVLVQIAQQGVEGAVNQSFRPSLVIIMNGSIGYIEVADEAKMRQWGERLRRGMDDIQYQRLVRFFSSISVICLPIITEPGAGERMRTSIDFLRFVLKRNVEIAAHQRRQSVTMNFDTLRFLIFFKSALRSWSTIGEDGELEYFDFSKVNRKNLAQQASPAGLMQELWARTVHLQQNRGHEDIFAETGFNADSDDPSENFAIRYRALLETVAEALWTSAERLEKSSSGWERLSSEAKDDLRKAEE